MRGIVQFDAPPLFHKKANPIPFRNICSLILIFVSIQTKTNFILSIHEHPHFYLIFKSNSELHFDFCMTSNIIPIFFKV